MRSRAPNIKTSLARFCLKAGGYEFDRIKFIPLNDNNGIIFSYWSSDTGMKGHFTLKIIFGRVII